MKKKPEEYQIIGSVVEVKKGKAKYLYPALKIEDNKIKTTEIISDVNLLEYDNPEANRIEKEIIEGLKKLSKMYPDQAFFYGATAVSIRKLKEIL